MYYGYGFDSTYFLILIPFTRRIIFRITLKNKDKTNMSNKHNTIDGEIIDDKKDEL